MRVRKGETKRSAAFKGRQAQAVKTYRAAVKGKRKGEKAGARKGRLAQLKGRTRVY